ncbi:Bis(5'-nucleosyl)-tetraphosphatase PrpE [asymmetrical] [Thalassocella blandensis]|nr:Bis(5'-nucleosyl)-tetraphosphatase PrpE [asymmetrical] [Thalassocella blandensis]
MQYSGYDIIGDIHGCAFTLEKLLEKMDYVRDGEVYYHANRQAIFLGDIVDRGPHIREALHIVKGMVDAGSAQCILGNHEYNALGYITPTPETEHTREVKYVRAHNARHNRLIAETLTQFASYPEEWRMFLEWFRGLPAFLELPGFRVVHACWDEALIAECKERKLSLFYDKAFIQQSADKSTFEGRLLDRLTRGTDITLPEGRTITSKDGYKRRLFRTKFWANSPETYQDVVFQPDPLPEDIAQQSLSGDEKDALLCYGENEPPVFVGHYWLQGKPRVLRPNIACLDYSAVKYGRLVAYRFDGEDCLSDKKFAWVYVDASPATESPPS